MTDTLMTADLLHRLREGEGADYHLDIDIYAYFDEPDFHVQSPRFTSSLDACIALAEKVMPGTYISVRGASGPGTVNEWIVTVKDEPAKHKSLPRAFLIALITAKETEHDR